MEKKHARDEVGNRLPVLPRRRSLGFVRLVVSFFGFVSLESSSHQVASMHCCCSFCCALLHSATIFAKFLTTSLGIWSQRSDRV